MMSKVAYLIRLMSQISKLNHINTDKKEKFNDNY